MCIAKITPSAPCQSFGRTATPTAPGQFRSLFVSIIDENKIVRDLGTSKTDVRVGVVRSGARRSAFTTTSSSLAGLLVVLFSRQRWDDILNARFFCRDSSALLVSCLLSSRHHRHAKTNTAARRRCCSSRCERRRSSLSPSTDLSLVTLLLE